MSEIRNAIQHGIMHVHTVYSVNDGAGFTKDLVLQAKKLGAPAMAKTEHGNMMGTYEFINACHEAGIKPCVGVEAYINNLHGSVENSLHGSAGYGKRSHMVLMSMDYQGLQANMKAVTLSNRHINNGFPEMDDQILAECFGPGTPGHGHVIGTTACMGGVASTVLLRNKYIDADIAKKQVRLDKLKGPDDPEYLQLVTQWKQAKAQLDEALIQRNNAKEAAKASNFAPAKKAISGLKKTDPEEYAKKMAEIQAQQSAAEKVLETAKKAVTNARTADSKLRKSVNDMAESHPKWRTLKSEIEGLQAQKKEDWQLRNEAKSVIMKYIRIFGEDNFYVELQNHGIEEEAYCMPILASIAKELGCPVIAANDVHYVKNSIKDLRRRKLQHTLWFGRFEKSRPGDDQYYIKTDEELVSALRCILDEDTVKEAMENIGKIFERVNIELPHESHYPKYKGGDAKLELRRMAQEGIARKYGSAWTEVHQTRMEKELKVIEKMGYSDYFCIVIDFIQYAKKHGMVGPGRGSAVGSIVAYLTDITDIEPLHHGLFFERFLNEERVSMPDIDSDFSIELRDKVIDYVKEVYGEKAVCNIATVTVNAAKAAVKKAATALGLERHNDRRFYLSVADRMCRVMAEDQKATLADSQSVIFEQFKDDKAAMHIWANAQLLENVPFTYGMHAAGVIISDNGDVSEYVPLLYNTRKGRWCCQCDMVEAESEVGLLKMDFLGLRNLSIITEAIRNIKAEHQLDVDIEAIGKELYTDGRNTKHDFRGNTFDEIFATGKTDSVFQFESAGMKSMLKRFRPSNIDDIILLVACFRPGPLQYLDSIIDVKHGRKKPEYIVPEMKEILAETYGYPVYQEQIMQIFNKIAGFSLGEADIIRRYMSKKKTEKFAAYKDKFIEGLLKAGADKQRSEDFWNQLLEFSKYAFNKSHATAYAYVAYYTAWLKLNYPAEYMTAVLNYTATDKLPKMVAECKSMGLQILPPDLNKSGKEFTCNNGDILFGLEKVKGIGNVEYLMTARKERSFVGFQDFLMRGHTKKDITFALIDSGAFDEWCPNREAMKVATEDMLKPLKKAKEKLELMKTAPEEDREKLQTQYKTYLEKFSKSTIHVDIIEDVSIKLENEYKALGLYISGHPLDSYSSVREKRSAPIADAEPGRNILCGRVTSVKKTQTRSDGMTMLIFTLEDETDTIPVFLIRDSYLEYGNLVSQGAVLAVEGTCKFKQKNNEDEDDTMSMFGYKIQLLEKDKKSVTVNVAHVGEWLTLQETLAKVCAGDEYILYINDLSTGERRKTSLTVSKDILDAGLSVAQ